jgi:hypothetical protein
MGTYHSYVGDAKLEDSKDNWYRISGMNISRWNISPHSGVWNPIRKNQVALFNNEIGYLGHDKSVWSTCYAKVLNFTSNPYSSYNTWSRIVPTGNNFTIKDRNLFEARAISSTDIGEFTKSVYIGNSGSNIMFALTSVHCLSNNNLATSGLYPVDNSVFRPMLTLKPIGGGVIDKFTLKIRVTRYFSYITTQLYRLGYTVSILEGNESIIAERKYGYRIGRNGEELPDTAPFATRAVANQYFTTTNPPEVIAHTTPWGDDTVTDHLGWWWKLINGKCLYIPSFSRLPGMEQDWRDNGGVTTSDITFTEADAYTI